VTARRLHDITIPIRNGRIVYEGDPPVSITRAAAISEGQPANVSRIDFGAHTGTHIDAPVHFIEGGGGIETLPLDVLVGPAHVIDATHLRGNIDAAALASMDIPRGAERVLFKTANSALWDRDAFSPDFIGLTGDGAAALVERGARLAGIDYLSVAPHAHPAPAHHALLAGKVVILEGLDLRGIDPGEYELICLPLLIPGSDGAPARALLRDHG
jgi:arylformamidase